jgi:hypothetical protein
MIEKNKIYQKRQKLTRANHHEHVFFFLKKKFMLMSMRLTKYTKNNCLQYTEKKKKSKHELTNHYKNKAMLRKKMKIKSKNNYFISGARSSFIDRRRQARRGLQ